MTTRSAHALPEALHVPYAGTASAVPQALYVAYASGRFGVDA
jgi:hypothetical protein